MGRSEEEISAEMEKWQQHQNVRRQKRLALKSHRRTAKKEAEVKAATGGEA